jgi:hypothetical protein
MLTHSTGALQLPQSGMAQTSLGAHTRRTGLALAPESAVQSVVSSRATSAGMAVSQTGLATRTAPRRYWISKSAVCGELDSEQIEHRRGDAAATIRTLERAMGLGSHTLSLATDIWNLPRLGVRQTRFVSLSAALPARNAASSAVSLSAREAQKKAAAANAAGGATRWCGQRNDL